jgi:hypothetical protein
MTRTLIAAFLCAAVMASPTRAQNEYSNIQTLMHHLESTGKCFNFTDGQYMMEACREEGEPAKLHVTATFTVFGPSGLYACKGDFVYHGVDIGNGVMEKSDVQCPAAVSAQMKPVEAQYSIFLNVVSQMASWLQRNEANL